MIKTNLKNLFKSIPAFYYPYKRFRARLIRLTPTEIYIKHKWKRVFNDKPLDLENPKTYNEKLQWGKINADNSLAKQCADKIEVLKYVEEKIGSEYINKPIGIYSNTKSIKFSELPKQFVLKATHDSGSVLIVKDHNHIDYKKLREIEQSLKIDFGDISKEWVYAGIKPKIIVEKFLQSEDGKSLKDYKVFCFNGEAKIIQVDIDRFEDHTRNFYDTDWNRLNLSIQYPNAQYDVSKPELLDKMLSLTKVLAKPFNHVRVDWYISNGKLVFGEMTFFHGGGFEKFNLVEWEYKMGGWFDVSKSLSY